jgi:hypothetical protein
VRPSPSPHTNTGSTMQARRTPEKNRSVMRPESATQYGQRCLECRNGSQHPRRALMRQM